MLNLKATPLENEALAIAVFSALHESLTANTVFIGGMSLRLCYGSPRISEDLDFHTIGTPSQSVNWNAIAENASRILGINVLAYKPSIMDGPAVMSRFETEITNKDDPRRYPSTKIDMSRGLVLEPEYRTVRLGIRSDAISERQLIANSFAFRTPSLREHFAYKHLALEHRESGLKCSDIFDILWLHDQKVQFCPDIVLAKLPDYRKGRFTEILHRRADAGSAAILGGAYSIKMESLLPRDSTWLFNDRTARKTMASEFRALIHHHAGFFPRR